MNDDERLHLQQMIKENNVEETTEKIRMLKHSSLIKRDVEKFLYLKKKYPRLNRNGEQFRKMVQHQCKFIFTHYLNLFSRLVRDELDLNILATLLTILKRIEDGEIDQHQGSYEVGKVLKEMYIDSTLRRETKREKKLKKKQKKRTINISWSDYKKIHL